MEPIYLDHNDTTSIDPHVAQAIQPYVSVHFGNPSSAHAYAYAYASAPAEALRTPRRQVAGLIGADQDGIVFTGSGSEANKPGHPRHRSGQSRRPPACDHPGQ